MPKVVLNRVRRGAVGTDPQRQLIQALMRYAGVTPWGFVPEDRPAFDTALAAGRTLPEVAAASPAAAAIAGLAGQLAPDPARPGRQRGWWRG